MKQFLRDPDSILDYTIDWTDWLTDGDVIISTTVTASSEEIEITDIVRDDMTVNFWVQGRPAAKVTCTIVTAQGRRDGRSIILEARER